MNFRDLFRRRLVPAPEHSGAGTQLLVEPSGFDQADLLLTATLGPAPKVGTPQGWAVATIEDALGKWVEGEANLCPHLPLRPGLDTAGVVQPWLPDRISCLLCMTLNVPGQGTDLDHACDHCGRDTRDSKHGLFEFRAQQGPVVMTYFCCADCRD